MYLQGNIIIAGPEQLKSKKFKKTVIDYIFWAWTCELGFDEVHLLNVWGPHFQKKIWFMYMVLWLSTYDGNDTHCHPQWLGFGTGILQVGIFHTIPVMGTGTYLYLCSVLVVSYKTHGILIIKNIINITCSIGRGQEYYETAAISLREKLNK